jgi:hypothetical protein
MTNTFRRHHKTIMWIIIVATIVTFVYYLTPNATRTGGGGGAAPSAPAGTIDGETISQPQFEAALREAKVAVFMNTRRWLTAQETTQELPDLAWQQLYIQAKLKESNLEVPLEATAEFTRMRLGLKPGQTMPKEAFREFVRNELNEKGRVGEEDFYQWVHDQVGGALLMKLYGMNGELITSEEVESFFRRDHDMMTVELARFPVSNYIAKIVPTDQDIQDLYTRRQAAYRLPPREQINYIFFNITNYLKTADTMMAGISNLDSRIDQTYLSHEASSWKDEAGNQLSAEAAKAKIREDSRLQVFARQAAETNAIQLIKLFQDGRKSKEDQPISREELNKFAASNGLTVVTTPPFDEQNPPAVLQVPPSYLQMLFQLTTNSPEDQYRFVPATNGYFYLGLEAKLPSENQPLEAVRARVIEDYRQQKAMELTVQAGTNFDAAVRNGQAKGMSFGEICAAQKVKPETLTPFSHETKSIPEISDEAEFEDVKGLAYQLPVGQIARFYQTQTGGFVVYLKARAPVDEAIVKRDLPGFLASQREMRQTAAFGIWLNREKQMHVHITPAAKPAAETPPSSG